VEITYKIVAENVVLFTVSRKIAEEHEGHIYFIHYYQDLVQNKLITTSNNIIVDI
jgi:hypothetical protein